MGVYRAAVITEGGQGLIAQALAEDEVLSFTSAKTSSHVYPTGTNITALTGLQGIEQSAIPFASKVINGNVAQVSVRFDNDAVTQQYQIQTIGLYARIGDGPETLFSVIQATVPDEMPVQSETSPSAFIYNIQSTVQGASQITITVNPAGAATVQDILDIEYPVFDDTGEVEGIGSFPDFLATMVSKMDFFKFFRNLKAGLQFVLHAGELVNNCTSEAADLPLAAAQGKVLMDMVTKLNSDNQIIQFMPNFVDGKYHSIRGYKVGKLVLLCGSFTVVDIPLNTDVRIGTIQYPIYTINGSRDLLFSIDYTALATLTINGDALILHASKSGTARLCGIYVTNA